MSGSLTLAWLTTSRAFQLFQIGRKGAVILIAILLGHSEIAITEIGNYEMLFYLSYVLSFFWLNGALQGVLSLYPKIPQQQNTFIPQVFLVLFLGWLALGSLLWVGQDFLLPIVLQKSALSHLGWFTIFMVSNMTASLQEHWYLLREERISLAVYGVISAVLFVAAVAIPVIFKWPFVYAIQALAVLGVSKLIWLSINLAQHCAWTGLHRNLLIKWWIISWPLAAYSIVGGLNHALGPWLVGHFFTGNEESFALYRYGARELPLLMALAVALSSAMIPVLARQLNKGQAELKRETRQLYHLLFPISILALITSQYWFPWVFSAEFAASIPLFNTFLLLTIPHLVFSRTILVALDDTRWVPLFAGTSFIVQLSVGFILIPKIGLLGVAWAAVISFSTEKLLMTIYVWWRHRISWLNYTPWQWLLGYSLVLIITYLYCL